MLSVKKMILQKKNSLKKKKKSVMGKEFTTVQNGSVALHTFEHSLKPFKGTKSYLENLENNSKTLKSRNKLKVASYNPVENHSQEKNLKYDPLKVMSKLEQFSDVWNDCPNVENPKGDFEIVSVHGNKRRKIDNQNDFGQKTNISNSSKKKESLSASKSGKTRLISGKINQEKDDHPKTSYEGKSMIEKRDNKINLLKHYKVEDSLTLHGKYDSKLAEIKRKKAVEEQSQLHADQKNIIKKALSSMDSKQQINKKIVFSDAEDNEEFEAVGNAEGHKSKKQKLFEDDDSDADLELKVNNQFKGKKGQKLLELQSKFASDSRFTLDSRFHENETESEKEEDPVENFEEEKKKQLEILESIIKQPIRLHSESRKLSEKKYDRPSMVRFDPTREDHQKYLLKTPKSLQEEEETTANHVKKPKKNKSLPTVKENKPVVSSEKIYAVKEDLKEVLKKDSNSEFSLLKLFGTKDKNSNTQPESSESVKKLKYATKNPFRYDSSESEVEEEEPRANEEKNTIAVKPTPVSWRTTFFFTDSDTRLKEAEEFLKGPEEHEGDQEFAEKRKMLKDFIRHKLKNSNRKKDPFKKKLGGVKKKAFHKKKGK